MSVAVPWERCRIMSKADEIKPVSGGYDFGDDWIHEIRLEEWTNALMSVVRCLDGEGVAPPEDCGGIGGYAHFKKLLAKKRKTEDDLAQIEWFLGDVSMHDLGTFNLEMTNKLLTKMEV